MPRKLFNIKLSDEEREQLRRLAAKDARSESAMLRYLLIEAVRKSSQDNPAPERATAS